MASCSLCYNKAEFVCVVNPNFKMCREHINACACIPAVFYQEEGDEDDPEEEKVCNPVPDFGRETRQTAN